MLTPSRYEIDSGGVLPIVSTDDVKAALKISGTAEDDRIDSIVLAVGEQLQQYCRRPLINQEVLYFFDEEPEGDCPLVLTRTPIRTVRSVDYWNGSAWTSLPTSKYTVVGLWDKQPPPQGAVWIDPVEGGWDFTPGYGREKVRVEAVSGYQNTPPVIKEAAIRLASTMYSYRAHHAEAVLFSLPELRAGLEAYRRDTNIPLRATWKP